MVGLVVWVVLRNEKKTQIRWFDLRSVDTFVRTALEYHSRRDVRGVELLSRPGSVAVVGAKGDLCLGRRNGGVVVE